MVNGLLMQPWVQVSIVKTLTMLKKIKENNYDGQETTKTNI